MKLLYGTGNTAKFALMTRRLSGLNLQLESLFDKKEVIVSVKEDGRTLLENARQKAKAYYEVFQMPVFSCDTMIYFKNEEFPKELQPGVHTRRIEGRMCSDEEMICYYQKLAGEFGGLTAQYQSAVCCYIDQNHVYECEEETLWGKPFLLTDSLHEKYQPGFPLDGLSADLESGASYYDLAQDQRDEIAMGVGIRNFFTKILAESENLK